MTFTLQVEAKNLAGLVEAFEKSPRVAVERGAFVAKQIITKVLRSDVPSGTVRNARGAKVSVNYQMASGSATSAQVRARGPWQLFNNRTSEHLIIARGLGTRSTAQAVTSRLGAKAAFGGSGRGMFRASARQLSGSKRAIAEGRGVKVARALVLSGNLRGYAFHPGTSGKRTWQRGVEAAEGPMWAEMADVMGAAVRAALK